MLTEPKEIKVKMEIAADNWESTEKYQMEVREPKNILIEFKNAKDGLIAVRHS